MTLFAKYTIKLAGSSAARRFEQATEDVLSAQEAKLASILRRNADTEYGREHGFASIGSQEEYRRAVPVVEFEALRARVDRMARGEHNVLTAEDPVMFARTSGTAGEPKLIPVTPTCHGRDHRDPMRTWLYRAQQDHPDVFRGKVLSLVSPAVEGHTQAGIPYGSTSGFIYKHMPRAIQGTYVIPYELFELEDYHAKYYALMRLGLAEDVTFLCTANPSTIAKLCETTQERADELVKDVRDGTLSAELEMPGPIRAVIEARCRPDAKRARALEAMRALRGGELLPGDFWPNLALIGCWKGGTVGAYVERFPQWFDPDQRRPIATRDWGYLSSEARGSIPLSDEGSGGVLTVNTNVFEFVELADVDERPDEPEGWTYLGAHEVEAPREYYVFLTTTGGLYRYDINDIVRVEGCYNQAPVLTFQRKGRGMTSLTGEKVSVNQVIDAVAGAAKDTGVRVAHFKAVAEVDGACYVFQVECEDEPSEPLCAELLRAIERRLCEQNLEYCGKRASLRLADPRLVLMKRGWYDASKAKQGQRLFQSKTVLLEPKQGQGDETVVRQMRLREVGLQPAGSARGE